MFSLFFSLIVFIVSFPLYAQFPWDSLQKDDEKTYQLEINTRGMNFFNEDKLRYFVGARTEIHPSFLDIGAYYTYSFTEKHHYFRVYEMAGKLKREDGEWILGRKTKEWSWDDGFWNRNLWEPVYNEDILRPQPAGLIGLFRDFDYSGGQLSLFGSFFFLPDSGPYFKQVDGQLVSENPWFISPSFQKIGNIVPVYQFENENIVSIKDLFQFSFAGRISYEGFYLAYAHKPMNELQISIPEFSLPLDKKLQGTYEKGYKMDIPLKSIILDHHIVSAGWTIRSMELPEESLYNTVYLFSAAATYFHPEIYKRPFQNTIFFQPEKQLHLSTKGEIHLTGQQENTKIHIAYTHQIDVEEETQSHNNVMPLLKMFPDIGEQDVFHSDLFKFSRAISAGINHNMRFNDTDEVDLKLRVIYDWLKEYFLCSLQASYVFDDSFGLMISGDVLFNDFPFSIEQIEENIDGYKNRSRIFGGLSYVF